MSGLVGRGVVVTGGSRGIGLACAEALAEAGGRVVVSARSEAGVEAAAGALREAGHEAWGIPCDVTDEASVAALADAARGRLGEVDILVNNAGVAPSNPVHRITRAEWDDTLAVNATGAFLCTRAFLPDMVARRRGRIVSVASIAARVGAAYIATYAASKHALLGFTRSVAAEVAAKGVTVNAVCPGYVATDMMDLALDRMAGKTGKPREEGIQHIEALSPQGRIFQPEEVAFLVVTLCDARARGINGQGIVLDGGGVQA